MSYRDRSGLVLSLTVFGCWDSLCLSLTLVWSSPHDGGLVNSQSSSVVSLSARVLVVVRKNLGVESLLEHSLNQTCIMYCNITIQCMSKQWHDKETNTDNLGTAIWNNLPLYRLKEPMSYANLCDAMNTYFLSIMYVYIVLLCLHIRVYCVPPMKKKGCADHCQVKLNQTINQYNCLP